MKFIRRAYRILKKVFLLDKLGLDYYALTHKNSSIHRIYNFSGE